MEMLSTTPFVNVYNVPQNASSSTYEPNTKKFKSDLSYNCIVCGDINENPDELYEHMRQHHSEMYVPTHTAEVFNLDDDDSDFDINDDEYSDLSRLLEPICEIHQLDEELVMTPISSEDPSQLAGLASMESADQRKLVLPQGPGRGRRREASIEKSPTSPKSCLFQCTLCDRSFTYAGDLAKHIRSHTQNKPYQCSICHKTFTHIGSLNTHIRIHSGVKPYKCKQCPKAFAQSSSLMVHTRTHSNRKPYQCTVCDKGFVSSSSLTLHMKVHSDEGAQFPCTDCDNKFKSTALLAEHLLTHTDTSLYQCSICRSTFKQSTELVQHMKNHTGDKPFVCTICDKSFTQSGSLNTHMRIHTGQKPFACKKCDKQFTQASSLSMHLKVHTTDRIYSCTFCDKTYSQQSHLNKHMLVHVPGDLFTCKWCKQLYIDAPNLTVHVGNAHGINLDHEDNSPVACIICQADFINGADLLHHLREHSKKW